MGNDKLLIIKRAFPYDSIHLTKGQTETALLHWGTVRLQERLPLCAMNREDMQQKKSGRNHKYKEDSVNGIEDKGLL
ncbi:MAG TPA: hypothetical protein VNM45_15560 [Bacillus sp. (in: firmicutes)]|nr:hypothetical protein [Bacillus sp. (in: firmicutes)]